MDLIKTFEQTQITKKIPDFRPGDTVRIQEKIREKNKERIQVFEGVLIRKRGSGINATFTLRKIAAGGIGVERIFPLYLPSLVKIEVIKRGKVRRAKLYYLRKRQEKAARLKEKKLTAEELEKLKYEEKVEKSVKGGKEKSKEKSTLSSKSAKSEKKETETKIEKEKSEKAETKAKPESKEKTK